MYHPNTGDTFDHWSDVLSGGLSLSAVAATQHFMSNDFDQYADAFSRKFNPSVVGMINSFSINKEARVDRTASGHFISVFFPGLSASLGDDIAFLAEIMESTGAAIIPGLVAGLIRDAGFSFRVNLAQDSPEFRRR
ncbi:MAG: hypothetical protein WDM81_01655 [Rhizomicrobium sp.]